MNAATAIALIFVGSAARAHAAEGLPTSRSVPVESPRRDQRRFVVAVSPDLYVLHAQEFADLTGVPLVLRVSGNITPRISVNASYGSLPGQLRTIDVGAEVALSDEPLTPYAGIAVGQLLRMSQEVPDHTDIFTLGALGLTFSSQNGLDLSVEGAAGYQREAQFDGHRASVMLRAGVRVGYRFSLGS
jgi:hypothetical protein